MDTKEIVKALGNGEVCLDAAQSKSLSEYIGELEGLAECGRQQLSELKKEVSRLGGIAEPALGAPFFEELTERLNFEQLSAMKKMFERRTDQLLPPAPQLRVPEDAKKDAVNDGFMI